MPLRINNKIFKVPNSLGLKYQMQKPQSIKDFKIILITLLKILEVLELGESIFCFKQIPDDSQHLQSVLSVHLIMSQFPKIKEALDQVGLVVKPRLINFSFSFVIIFNRIIDQRAKL